MEGKASFSRAKKEKRKKKVVRVLSKVINLTPPRIRLHYHNMKRSLSWADRRRVLGLRARATTYLSAGMSFKLETVRGGH